MIVNSARVKMLTFPEESVYAEGSSRLIQYGKHTVTKDQCHKGIISLNAVLDVDCGREFEVLQKYLALVIRRSQL